MTKILLVEDDKSLREIYGVRLLAEGYDIVSAGDGEEALAMAKKIAVAGVPAVVIDTETDFISLGVAQKVAVEMGATYYHLAELSDSAVIHIAQQAANC